MQRWSDGFASTLAGFTLQTLEADSSPIFAISERWELWYYNPAYEAFAARNHEAVLVRYPIGSNVLDAIAGDARELYARQFARVMRSRSPWFHEYTCASAARYRRFHQGVYPLLGGHGLVLINSLIIESALDRAPYPTQPVLEPHYAQPSGLITQCSNCRRTLRNDGSEIWDWVPDWVAEPPVHTSHTICQLCFDYHWRR